LSGLLRHLQAERLPAGKSEPFHGNEQGAHGRTLHPWRRIGCRHADARMSRLFGVTMAMAERGVSQLISVGLEGAVRLRKAVRPPRKPDQFIVHGQGAVRANGVRCGWLIFSRRFP
jgi:hypothetical protein